MQQTMWLDACEAPIPLNSPSVQCSCTLCKKVLHHKLLGKQAMDHQGDGIFLGKATHTMVTNCQSAILHMADQLDRTVTSTILSNQQTA